MDNATESLFKAQFYVNSHSERELFKSWLSEFLDSMDRSGVYINNTRAVSILWISRTHRLGLACGSGWPIYSLIHVLREFIDIQMCRFECCVPTSHLKESKIKDELGLILNLEPWPFYSTEHRPDLRWIIESMHKISSQWNLILEIFSI